MSLSPESSAGSYVLRGIADGESARPARMSSNLATSPYAQVGIADARLVDPHLAAVVDEACNAARARGFKAGFSSGVAAGREEGLARMQVRMQELAAVEELEMQRRRERFRSLEAALADVVAGVVARQEPLVSDLRDIVATMTVDLAEALVGHHLAVGDCGARDAVSRALALVPREASVTVSVNPADLAGLTGSEHEVAEHGRTVRFAADPTVDPGGAVARAGALEVDAQLRHSLARVHRILHP